MQQFTRITDRQSLGNRRQVFRAQVHGQLVGALTQQRGDAVFLPHLLGLQLRHAGFDRGQTRIGAFHVQLIADTGITQADGDLARLLLVLQVGQGDFFPQLCTAQLTVGVHQFGNHGDLQLVQVGLDRLLLGVGRLQVALDAAKQVDLPRHVQAQVVAFAVDPVGGLAGNLALAQITADPAGDGRHGVIADVITDRPRRFPASEGDTQITVALERFGDQLVEGRIFELLPPDAFETRAVKVFLTGRTISRGGDVGRFKGLGLVVRADGTGAQRQYQQARQESFQTHQCDSS
ncbi:hypothetical protein D3C86_1294120 [compost metagenome]